MSTTATAKKQTSPAAGIDLVPLGAVRASTYNPRLTDPRRLELIQLSLRKLGFLLPLFADPTGEIISGHQRHLAATVLGLKRVPVRRTKPMDLAKRKAVNIAFNRGTNDLKQGDTPADLTEAIEKSDVHALAAGLPDLEGDELYPCLRYRRPSSCAPTAAAGTATPATSAARCGRPAAPCPSSSRPTSGS